eukprot:6163443-Pleurochrysis_carterae.AAC.3
MGSPTNYQSAKSKASVPDNHSLLCIFYDTVNGRWPPTLAVTYFTTPEDLSASDRCLMTAHKR